MVRMLASPTAGVLCSESPFTKSSKLSSSSSFFLVMSGPYSMSVSSVRSWCSPSPAHPARQRDPRGGASDESVEPNQKADVPAHLYLREPRELELGGLDRARQVSFAREAGDLAIGVLGDGAHDAVAPVHQCHLLALRDGRCIHLVQPHGGRHGGRLLAHICTPSAAHSVYAVSTWDRQTPIAHVTRRRAAQCRL